MMEVFSPLNHSDYSQIDSDCDCQICRNWREKLQILNQSLSRVSGHHKSCFCNNCVVMWRDRTSYLAALNRRDLYSEMSWYSEDRPDGSALMKWITEQIHDYSDKWWSERGGKITIGEWMERFSNVISSGATIVFSGIPAGLLKFPNDMYRVIAGVNAEAGANSISMLAAVSGAV